MYITGQVGMLMMGCIEVYTRASMSKENSSVNNAERHKMQE